MKFSLAISSMFSCWRRRSCSIDLGDLGVHSLQVAGRWDVFWGSILLTRRSWRPPSNWAARKASTILRAASGGVVLPARQSTLALLCWRARAAVCSSATRAARTPGPCWRRCSCRCRWCRRACRTRPCCSATLLRHRLRVIGVIRGLLGVRAEIRQAHAALLRRCCLSASFSSKPPWSAPEGHGRPACALPRRPPAWPCSMNRSSEAMPCSIWSRQFEIDLVGPADRIADVLFEHVERFVEFAQQKSLFRRLRIEQHDRVHVAVGHAEDVIGLLHQLRREHAAALAGDVDARVPSPPAPRARWAAGRPSRPGRPTARGNRRGPATAWRKMPFGHRAAADIAGANEQDGLHQMH